MSAGVWNIRAATNEDFVEQFTFYDSPGVKSDVSAWVSTMQVVDDVGGRVVLDVGVSGSFSKGTGTITPSVPESVMRTVPAGVYRYDYRGDPPGGTVRRLAGLFVLEAGATTP